MISGQGSHPTTVYSVAQLDSVSIATVSRVLQGTGVTSPRIRAAVLKAVAELECVPLQSAHSLAVKRHEAHGSSSLTCTFAGFSINTLWAAPTRAF